MDVLHGLVDHGADDATPKFRRADNGTTFLSRPDSKSLFSTPSALRILAMSSH